MHPWSSNAILAHPCAPHDIISYTVWKFEVNPTDSSGDIDNFVHPL